MISRRHAMAAGAAGTLTGVLFGAVAEAATVPALATPPTVDNLVKKRALRDVALSPDGAQIAVLNELQTASSRTAYVNIFKSETPTTNPTRVVLGDIEVESIAWANPERLLIWMTHDRTETDTTSLNRITTPDKFHIRRLMAIGVDGSAPVLLLRSNVMMERFNADLGMVEDFLPDEPRHILMRVGDYTVGRWTLQKVDVYTGEAETFEVGGVRTTDWWCAGGRAFARFDMVDNRARIFDMMVRAADETEWRKARRIRRDEYDMADFSIVAFTNEPDTLLVRAAGEGDAARVLRKYNLKTTALGEVVSSRDGRDIMRVVVDHHDRYVAAGYLDDRIVYDCADPSLAGALTALNGAFQNQANLAIHDMDDSRQKLILYVTGPRIEGGFFLFNRQTKKLDTLGFCKPWLPGAGLAGVETLDVPLPGGPVAGGPATMRAYLTVPQGSGPRPLVVLPHGGPEVRDAYSFDLFAQAFAAQGWLVLQPNFRGSDGYGRAFANAGRRHWGTLMQDDVEAAVDQVVASGRVDAGRVAIWGASYGGYAALMGAVRRPAFYKAAVSVAGVTDLLDMMAREKRDGGEDSASYAYWVTTVGDPRTEEARLTAESPRFQAAKIAAPVLLMHGLDDTTVYPNQSKLMAQALKSARKSVQHIELADVGHRNWKPEVQKKVLETSVNFIKTAFGVGAA